MSDLLSRITISPDIRFGKPCIRNMRFAVQDVLEYLAAGETRESLLEEFPFLENDDISAALEYAANNLPRKIVAAE